MFNKVYELLRDLASKPEGFFVVVGLIAGLIFILIVPPFQTPDENVHLYRAYEVAELKTPKIQKEGQYGSMLPASIRLTEQRVHGLKSAPGTPGQIMFNVTEKYSYRYTKSALLDIPLNQKERIFYATAGSPAYVPLSYLPQATTVGIANIFNAPVIVTLYAIRVTNLLVWIVLGFLSIKLFPWRKWALAGVCLLPVVVSQSISVGLDTLIFGATLVFLSLLFRSYADERFRLNHYVPILAVSGVIMVTGKSVLALLLPLVFLVRGKQLGSRHTFLVKLIISLLPIIAYTSWVMVGRGNTSAADSANASIQLHHLVTRPWEFAHQLFNTLFLVTPSGSILAESLVGNFGWLDTPLAPLFINTGYVVLGILLFVGYEKNEARKILNDKKLLLLCLVAFAYSMVVFLAMYIYFTQPSDNHIKGVNGRYLLPVFFLLLPLGLKNWIKMDRTFFVRCVKGSTFLLLIASFLTLIFRYYINFVPT